MKSLLKKICMPLILSVICGFVCGRVVYSIYEDNNVLDSNIIYLLKDDSYSNYDSMKASYLSESYTYFEEDGTYNTIVALTKDKDNISKIEEVYGSDLTILKYLLNDKELINTIDEYDNKIKNTSDKEEIKEIVSSMNNIYRERDDIKMVKMS